MRLGYTPTKQEYDATRGRGPTSTIIGQRFGSWSKGLRAAGLEIRRRETDRWTTEQCIEGIRLVAKLIGHTPRDADYRAHSEQLRAAQLPVHTASIRVHVAPTWEAALKKAGLR